MWIWTVIKVWTVINFLGILFATAVGIYRDITEDKEEDDDAR